MNAENPKIARHLTAIGRASISKPVRLAIEARLLEEHTTVMDYGCGRGGDIQRLQRRGIDAVGWDPAHRPDGPRRRSELVNLGYVLNVIEAPKERVKVLKSAWSLAGEVMIVAALVSVDTSSKAVPFGDGVLTTRGTFQKYFHQQELEHLISQSLEVQPVALGIGIFAVVRSEARRATLIASRLRHRPRALPARTAKLVFKENQAVLEPLVKFVEERGRFPSKAEAGRFEAVASKFGSVAKAIRLLQKALPDDHWTRAVDSAKADLLVYLALAKFGGHPRFGQLEPDMQEDIRAHFGSYRHGLRQADEVLFCMGQPGVLKRAAESSELGKVLPDSIYMHFEAVPQLPVVLRLFEGCARRYLGAAEGANIVKLGLRRPVVSYLTYKNFWKDPHPVLQRSLRVDLQTFRIGIDDYSQRENPPILHRKELLIGIGHSKYQLFRKLTAQEERHGLFKSPRHIGTLSGWERALAESGWKHKGHRLVRRPLADGSLANPTNPG